MIFMCLGYLMHIRIREGEVQQQQPSNPKNADGVLRTLRLFKVAFIFVTFINTAKMSIRKVMDNTLY